MRQLVIDESNARKIYKEGINGALEETFGKAFFAQKLTDRIKNIDDVLRELGMTQEEAWSYDNDEPHVIAYKQLCLIVRCLNEGWVPDWDNSNEYKWYPWFYMNKPGFRLGDVDHSGTAAGVGSRLVFKSEALAKFAADTFLDIYKTYYTLS